MLTPSWQSSLGAVLERLWNDEHPPRLVVIGIGHELWGDDDAGNALVRALRGRVDEHYPVLLIDAGCAPENFAGQVRRFQPDLVILVDAAQLNHYPPGTIAWLDWRQTGGVSASSHALPLHMFAQYLSDELGCEIALLGIQPGQMVFGIGLSEPIQNSLEVAARDFWEILNDLNDKSRPKT